MRSQDLVERGEEAPGIDPLRTVHNSVYTARAFELEQERIFRRVWNFVCHESELATPGRFLTTEIAGDPILVARRLSGDLAGYHNVCRHRGCLVVDEPTGQAGRFQCPYHHWTYSLDGALVSVPGEDAYAGTGFAREQFGLLPVRVESVYGLVFACLDPAAPSLADYLGPEMVAVLERPFGRAPFAVFRHNSWVLEANWKMFAENGRDGYHVPFVHQSFLARGSPPLPYELFPSGHALQRLALGQEAVDEATWRETARFPLPGVAAGEGYIANVLPDLVVMLRSNVTEILSQVPLTHDRTRYEVRVLGLADDDAEQRAVRELSYQTWLATQQPEDRRVMELQQRGLRSRGARTSVIARGADATSGTRGDDNRLRQFWQVWRAWMRLETNAVPGA
jgi:phenylpropionate dioxygenase-like ring-hydroxylating dioxygenase large terminal subunit